MKNTIKGRKIMKKQNKKTMKKQNKKTMKKQNKKTMKKQNKKTRKTRKRVRKTKGGANIIAPWAAFNPIDSFKKVVSEVTAGNWVDPRPYVGHFQNLVYQRD
jgi:fatty acid desaturase